MSAAGSNRVKVVHRKLTADAAARLGSSVITTRGQSANAGCSAKLAASAEGVAPTIKHPGQKIRGSKASPGGATAGRNSRGSVRTGSPKPSQTPFDPSFTAGPV